MAESKFVPSGDLSLEYTLPDAKTDLSAWAYQPPQGDESPYVALALRPKLPRRREEQASEQVIVVDTSRSMVGERLGRAKAVVRAMVKEVGDRDRVQVLACDSECVAWPAGSAEGGAEASANAERFLSGIVPDGASDLSAMVRQARAAGEKTRGDRSLKIVYVGDGAASVGPTKPDHLTAEVKRGLGATGASVHAVAIGADADTGLLGALARGGGGVLVPYVPGQRASEVALAAENAVNGVSLREAELVLPAGFVTVAPSTLDTIRAGSETVIVGRMTSKDIEGEAVLRGKVGGEAFEQKYPLHVVATTDAGNGFVPRLYAAGRIADLERSGGEGSKTAMVELSKKFSVASRHTSLLVLESEAMMTAFGLKRAVTPQWTGESSATATSSKGTLKLPDSADPQADEAPEASAASADRKEVAAAAPAAKAAPMRMGGRLGRDTTGVPFDEDSPWRGRGRMVAMKKVWDRHGSFVANLGAWHDRDGSRIIAAEGASAAKPDSRQVTRDLFGLYAQHGRIDQASDTAQRWATRDALDPEALLARADVAARGGDRKLAVRILGSVVDIRPDDATLQNRLASLYEQLGDRGRACAHRVALAEQKADDLVAQAAAVRCARTEGMTDLADRILADVASDKKAAVQKSIDNPPTVTTDLRGDVRMDASWDAEADLDLALIDKNGQRLSWLGGGKAPVSFTAPTGLRSESLAFANLSAGSYVIEVNRTTPSPDQTPIRGTITLRVVGETRQIPFTLTGNRLELGRADVSYTSRLVPY
jgi:Mg-chelatase subunit ChlD